MYDSYLLSPDIATTAACTMKEVLSVGLTSIRYDKIGLPYISPSSHTILKESPMEFGTANTATLMGSPGGDRGTILPTERP